MNSEFFASLLEHYEWQLSIVTFIAIQALTFVLGKLMLLVPTFREAHAVNKAAYEKKMKIQRYADNKKWNKKWGLIFALIIWLGLVPFALTAEAQPLWQMALDIFVILMVYDFFYYLTHRFLFHDGGWFKGPLMWVHAVHHQQHNPCREDSSYIHPIEVAAGLGLYVATILILAQFMGPFHFVTIIVTWITFIEINLHNHDLWTSRKIPFLKYMSDMHHHHHAKFTGGNFATITVLYDWMFGTLDHGDGYGKHKVKPKTETVS